MTLTTKENIIKAALELFSQHSYYKVSLKDVADKANISKGALFHYFPTKLDLAEAVMKKILEEIEKNVRNVFSMSIDDHEKLERLIDLAIEKVELSKNNMRSLDFISEICRELFENNRYSFIEEYYRKLKDLFASMLRKAGVVNPDVRAALFMITLNGLIHYSFFYPKPIEESLLNDLKKEIVEVMFS